MNRSRQRPSARTTKTRSTRSSSAVARSSSSMGALTTLSMASSPATAVRGITARGFSTRVTSQSAAAHTIRNKAQASPTTVSRRRFASTEQSKPSEAEFNSNLSFEDQIKALDISEDFSKRTSEPATVFGRIAKEWNAKMDKEDAELAKSHIDFSYIKQFEENGFTELGSVLVPVEGTPGMRLPIVGRVNPSVPKELLVDNLHKKLTIINPAYHNVVLFDERDPNNVDKQFQISPSAFRIINKYTPHAHLQSILLAKVDPNDKPFKHKQYDEIFVYNPVTEDYYVPYDPLCDDFFKSDAKVTFYTLDENGFFTAAPKDRRPVLNSTPTLTLPYSDPGKRPTSIHTAQFEKDFKPFHEWQADGAKFPIQWLDETRLYHRNRYDIVSGPYAEQKHTNASGLAFQLTDTPHRDMFNAWERVRHKKAFRRGLKTYAAILTSFVAFELFMWGGTHFPSQEIFAELKELNMRLTYHSTIFGKSFDEVLDMPMKDVIRGLADRPLLRVFPRRDELHIERVVFDEATNAMKNTGEFMDPAKLFDNNRPNSSSTH